MSTKTYIVDADDTLFVVEATSIVEAAAKALNVEKPIREFIRWRRSFSNIKARGNRGTYAYCSVYLSFDELTKNPDGSLDFTKYDYCIAA